MTPWVSEGGISACIPFFTRRIPREASPYGIIADQACADPMCRYALSTEPLPPLQLRQLQKNVLAIVSGVSLRRLSVVISVNAPLRSSHDDSSSVPHSALQLPFAPTSPNCGSASSRQFPEQYGAYQTKCARLYLIAVLFAPFCTAPQISSYCPSCSGRSRRG